MFYTPLHNVIRQYCYKCFFCRTIVESSYAKLNKLPASKLAFKITRTPSGNLPVYVRIRAHGTIVSTQVRHIYGNVEELKQQLRILCESPVRERVGSLEIRGLHVKKVKKWLQQCGYLLGQWDKITQVLSD